MIEVRLEKLDEQNNWVPEVIQLPVEEDFSIDDQALDAELCKIGRLLFYYGDLASELKAQASRKKQDLEFYYAETAKRIRNASLTSKHKTTEGAIKEEVLKDTGYQALAYQLIESEKDAGKVDNFFKSLNKKADVLISLCYKQKAEIARATAF